MMHREINDKEFHLFRNFLFEKIGIQLSEAKKSLVCGRLSRRLQALELDSFDAYFKYIVMPVHRSEMQMAIDLLTTNETHFFREPKHFEFLRETVLLQRHRGRSFQVWSAASSSGEEPYSVAMQLADCIGSDTWSVTASDVSSRVLEKARTGLYPMERAQDIPPRYLTNYCLKGTGKYDGFFMVDRHIRNRVNFFQINLNETLPSMESFDVIFLRNVLIYFNPETKQKVVSRVVSRLRPGGYLVIGHSESLNGVTGNLKIQMPSVYRKE